MACSRLSQSADVLFEIEQTRFQSPSPFPGVPGRVIDVAPRDLAAGWGRPEPPSTPALLVVAIDVQRAALP